MSQQTKIQWTDATWNVARGCTKVDADCRFCYMYRDSMDQTRYNPMQVVKTKTVFDFPLRYKEKESKCWEGRPLIFTSSLTDVFHEQIDGFRNEIWDIIRKCPHLIFQILTKRPERIIEHLPEDWGNGWDNVWLGTSVGSQKSIQRAIDLVDVPAKVKFLSLEPLHGPVDLSVPVSIASVKIPLIDFYDWIIVGGESGNEKGMYRYRPCEIEWLKSIVYYCRVCDVPVFVKQMGTHLSKQMKMSDRHGGNIEEFPSFLQFRQFPDVF